MGLQYTLQEQAETEVAAAEAAAGGNSGAAPQRLQRITLKIHFSTQICTTRPSTQALPELPGP